MAKTNFRSQPVRRPYIERLKHFKVPGVVRPKPAPGARDEIVFKRPGRPDLFYHITPESEGNLSLCVSVLQGLFEMEASSDWGVSVLLSAFMLIVNGCSERILKDITNSGHSIIPISFPSDAMFRRFRLNEVKILTQAEVAVFYGQLLFYPFKDFSVANYTHFSAMNSMVGVEAEILLLPMSLECAIRVKRGINKCSAVKRTIMKACLKIATTKEPPMALISNYMLGILEWTDMTAYSFILTALFRPGSPVLWHPAVAQEVDNFLHAVILVGKHDHPQYFKIFCHPAETFSVEPNLFPILFSVSTQVIMNGISTGQLKGVRNLNQKSVTELYKLHMRNLNQNLVTELYKLHMRWAGSAK